MRNECWKRFTCGSCLSEANDHDGCFWCYSTGTCEEAEVGLEPFGNCHDVGMTAAACECRPSEYTSCEKCATPAHPTCVWVDEGALVTGTVEFWNSWGMGAKQALPTTTLKTGACHSGWGFGAFGLVQNATLFNGGLGHFSVQMEVIPKEYFWAQCQLPNAGSALLMMGAIFVVSSFISLLIGAFTRRPRVVYLI